MAIRRSLVSRAWPVVVASLAGCDAGRDHASPDLYVVSVAPGDLQTNVAPNGAIVIGLSKPVAPASYTGNGQILLVDGLNTPQAVTIRPSPSEPASASVTITPVTPLAPNQSYGLAVRELVTGVDGDPIRAPFAMTFATGATLQTIPGFPPFLVPGVPPVSGGAPGTFTVTGALPVAADSHEAGRLQSGEVLITGGLANATVALRQAQVYRPSTGTWRVVANGGKNGLNFRRVFHTQTLLDNGQVLVAGGADGSMVHDTAELYDPLTDTFTALPQRLTHPRSQHAAVKLDNGNVLLIGGLDGQGTIRNTMEVYDVSSGTFTATQARLTIPRQRPTALRQADGRVCITGGQTYATSFGFFVIITVNSAETYAPVAGTSGSTGTIAPCGNRMSTTRFWHTATEFTSGPAAGLIVIIGGASNNPWNLPLSNADVYDWQAFNGAGGFVPIAQSMATPRWDHEAVLLPNGLVLVTGGYTAAFPAVCPVTAATELFDPFGFGQNLAMPYRGVDLSGRFALTQTAQGVTTRLPQPPLVSGLGAHSATALLNGTVLLAGGQDCAPGPVSVGLCTIYTP